MMVDGSNFSVIFFSFLLVIQIAFLSLDKGTHISKLRICLARTELFLISNVSLTVFSFNVFFPDSAQGACNARVFCNKN